MSTLIKQVMPHWWMPRHSTLIYLQTQCHLSHSSPVNEGRNLDSKINASFPLLFTTSGDVLCSKFSKVWETLNFKVVRWTRDRYPKINKSPTVSNGVRASSFEIWTADLAQSLSVGTLTNSWSFIFGDSNWKFCKVGYPVGPPKPDIQIQTLFYFL